MNNITSNIAFKEALASLSLAQQRRVGAIFTENVMEVTDGKCAEYVALLTENDDVTAEEMEKAYRAVQSIYVDTHLYSGFTEVDFRRQSAHFVAEACRSCLAPTFGEYSKYHLAEQVAGYCRMARMCACIQHEEEYPKFSNAEVSMKKEIDTQHQILSEFLEIV